MSASSEIDQLRANQRTLLKALQTKLAKALSYLQPEEAKWGDVIAAMRLMDSAIPAAEPSDVDAPDDAETDPVNPLQALRIVRERKAVVQSARDRRRTAG